MKLKKDFEQPRDDNGDIESAIECTEPNGNSDDTVVIYMGLEQLNSMADELNKRLSKETNINVVSKVSYQSSDVVSGNTRFFSKIKKEDLPESPAVIILGNHTQIPGTKNVLTKERYPISKKIKSFIKQPFLNLF